MTPALRKIVFTGAPCSGKTEIIGRLAARHAGRVVVVPEVAGLAFAMALADGRADGRKIFFEAIAALQVRLEEVAEACANRLDRPVMLLDRGFFDVVAYAEAYGATEVDALGALGPGGVVPRYDLVFNLGTAFGVVDEATRRANNRGESLPQVLRIAEALGSVWRRDHRVIDVAMAPAGIEDKARLVERLLADADILT
ncbi:hypothetical protein CKO38_08000 [Rhodospirillum rubrum]|uniref:ATP/GTP-binding protein n=1 Tax=Rhodospirillum rubrum TaxID=1085 RepID=UPI001907AB9D|nr:ATP-binding protein [Rhodospirillum rubrum]MBK1663937.1 hypothetical protein [Rhodospirillum rubrum]MBK1676613.1 hypothetical protein [Rhodospirillum rubrum]